MAYVDALANPTNLLTSILLTFFPLIVLFFPYLYTRRKDENIIAIIFNRGYIGFVVFYIAYFIFASILNAFTPNPNQYMTREYYQVPGTDQWSTEWDSAAVVREGVISWTHFLPIPLLGEYLFQHTLNSITNFLYYPIVILPFVFGISPIMSIIIISYQTWSEKRSELKPLKQLINNNKNEIRNLQEKRKTGIDDISSIDQQIKELEQENSNLMGQKDEIRGVIQRLQEIQFEMDISPFQEIRKRVKEKNWGNERELLKVLIAILPITLFLLMTILNVLGEEENPSLLQGTSMGWFLEIYFAYIASLVFCVYLIKAGQLSRKGKFLGTQLYSAMVQSLSTVGAFMSGLAVILFLVQYPGQIFVISFFVVYIIMVSVFFVLFLDIFEPFSIYLLIKLIETFKNLRLALKRVSIVNVVKTVITGVIVGFLLSVGFLAYRVSVSIFGNINSVHYFTFLGFTHNYFSFLICAALILFIRRWNWSIIGTTIITYLTISAVSILIFEWYNSQWYTLFFQDAWPPIINDVSIAHGVPFLTVASTVANISTTIWLTSIWKEGTFGNIQFIIPELRQIPVIWKGAGGEFLGVLAVPYNFLHPFGIIMIYGAILFLVKRKFHVEIQKGEGKTQFKSIYSEMSGLPTSIELKKKSDIILIGATPSTDAVLEQTLDERWLKIENGSKLRDEITGKMVSLNRLQEASGLTSREIYKILDELTFDIEVPFNQIITMLHKEFSFSFEEVTIDSMHVMMLDGRAVLSHTFAEESQVEPALVAGLFSAITSFAKEAVRSEQLLKTIDHGDVVLTIEYAKWVFAAIFADSTSTELRRKLGEFLVGFEKRHAKTLPMWLGDLDIFAGDEAIIDEVFSS
ncbi:MAG: hypothetical protein ACFFAJ_12310 [Candidatus Hodarchaeota archaeon]